MFFTVNNEAEAITLFALIIVAVGMLIFSEITDTPSTVIKIITAGFMFYLFTVTNSTILQVCFLGLTIYSLVRIIGR